MQKTYYTSLPQPIEWVTRDFLRVRVDIRQEDSDSETEPQFSALESVVYAPFSQNKIIETVFTDIFGNDYENKLINEYVSAQNGLYTDESEAAAKIKRYKDFLIERLQIKTYLEQECEKVGIK